MRRFENITANVGIGGYIGDNIGGVENARKFIDQTGEAIARRIKAAEDRVCLA